MPSVVVLGGGVGGMSVAQELAERGFDVVVLEQRGLAGGKARSIDVTEDRLGPNPVRAAQRKPAPAWVPGEHGFRFFPGFYKHVIDTMSRIPTDDGRRVSDNLMTATAFAITQYDRPMFQFPSRVPTTVGDAQGYIRGIIEYFSPITGLKLEDLAFFSGRLWQILTSCDERRLAEYEKLPWWTFVGAESRSDAYRKFAAQGITRSVVAAKAESASTRTIGNTFVQMVLTLFDPLQVGDDRLLNGPTSEAWIEHWFRYLGRLGVDYRFRAKVVGIQCGGGRVTGVTVERAGGREVVTGDYYVSALPVERMAPLITPALVAIDPGLGQVRELAENVEWMNGIQLYLRRALPIVPGHVIHIDTEWALTSVSQTQFWRPGTLDAYADAEVREIISVDISNWEAPGSGGKPARRCSRQEVFDEVWAQLQRSLKSDGEDLLHEEDVCGWFLDPDLRPDRLRNGELANTEALLVNFIDTWRLRPEAVTLVPNLFLASDYVRTYTDLATMEGANEAARRAANGIMESSGCGAPPCELWPLQEPPTLLPWREYDRARFRAGLPWDRTLLDTASAVVNVVAPGFDRAAVAVADLDGMRAAGSAAVARPLAGIGRGTATVPPDDGPLPFLDRLAWYRDLTLDRVRRELPQKEPQEHLYKLIAGFLDRPSKGLRPALMLATSRAYGGELEKSLPVAAGLELLHGAFLVHDDIEDDSELRGGRPTLHRRVGIPLALNAGDAMNALSMRLFRSSGGDLPAPAAGRLFAEIDHLVMESLEGQAMELGWRRERTARISPEDYLRLVLKKTGWYSFIHPLRIGALMAQPDDPDLERFNRFGFLLAAAFQVRDDVLNLTGSLSSYGKEIGGDLVEGKPTLILSHAFAHASADQAQHLRTFFARAGRPALARQVASVSDVLRRLGSIDWAGRAAAGLAGAARLELDRAFADARHGADLDLVRSAVDYVAGREV